MMTRVPSVTRMTALVYSSMVEPVWMLMTPVRGEAASGTALAWISAEVMTSISTDSDVPVMV